MTKYKTKFQPGDRVQLHEDARGAAPYFGDAQIDQVLFDPSTITSNLAGHPARYSLRGFPSVVVEDWMLAEYVAPILPEAIKPNNSLQRLYPEVPPLKPLSSQADPIFSALYR